MKHLRTSVFMLCTFQKSTIAILFVSIILTSCNKDFLFVDDFIQQDDSDKILVLKYSGETTTYNEYMNGGDLVRSIPDVQKSKFQLYISKTGNVEVFTEYLTPSQNLFQKPDVHENGEVKYEHLLNGTMHLYDANRNLLGEFDADQITEKYAELYQRLIGGEKNGMVTFFNVMNFNSEEVQAESQKVNQRFPDLRNAYDDHPNYKVVRNSTYEEDLQEEIISEIIIQNSTEKIQFISSYSASGTPLSRSQFGYENGKLVALVESRLDFTDPDNSYKAVSSTKFDNFELNINL
jgi:hypothetical protein